MVSIIIPTYNRGYTIKKSIESILNQTYKSFELIIVDDNSTDNTAEIVKSIKDERIRYIKQEKNLGANVARNRGVIESKGNFIAFQDSDDEWLPNKLEIQLDELKNNNADIVYCSFNRFENDKHEVIPKKNINDENIATELLKYNFISTQTILGKKECFESEKFDEKLPRFQDWDLVIRLSMKYKIHHVNKPLVNVYLQNDSITRSSEKGKIAINIMMDKYIDEIRKNKSILSRWYRMKIYNEDIKNNKTLYFNEAIREGAFSLKLVYVYIKSKYFLANKK